MTLFRGQVVAASSQLRERTLIINDSSRPASPSIAQALSADLLLAHALRDVDQASQALALAEEDEDEPGCEVACVAEDKAREA